MSSIFLIDGEKKLVELAETPYESEDILQELLEKYPAVLAGNPLDGQVRRFALVEREMPVPDSEGGSGRWSMDHLLLDQDAVPTFVEVKRSSDSRIRREVVGQMLDYAANGLVYWPADALRTRFEAKYEDPENEIRDLTGSDSGVEDLAAGNRQPQSRAHSPRVRGR